MAYFFHEIERDRGRIILYAFTGLVVFYFLGVIVLTHAAVFVLSFDSRLFLGDATIFQPLTWPTYVTILLFSFFVAAGHWYFSTRDLINSYLGVMGARAVDENELSHKMFMNVVEDVSVATGGHFLPEAWIIPNSSCNAFALQDFSGRSVIGITQGLLQRLNRSQLEAVVAHEMAHVAKGDGLASTVIASVFGLFGLLSDGLKSALEQGDSGFRSKNSVGRIGFLIVCIYFICSLLRFWTWLGAMFISRQREYRADAVAVRLTRNPLALAEALHIIDLRWKGSGLPAQDLEAVFIASPRYSSLLVRDGWLAELFCTHPPVEKRVGVLLSMAQYSWDVLDDAVRECESREALLVSPFKVNSSVKTADADTWYVLKGDIWCGPLTLEKARQFEGLTPETLVKKVSSGGVALAAGRSELFLNHHPTGPIAGIVPFPCPRCRGRLVFEDYEKIRVVHCYGCGGYMLNENDVLSILGCREMLISERILNLARQMLAQFTPSEKWAAGSLYEEKGVLCPVCPGGNQDMRRRFINVRYRIEVDKCKSCGSVWFDRDEMELLQAVYELDHPARHNSG